MSARYAILQVDELARLQQANCLSGATLQVIVGLLSSPLRRTLPGLIQGLGEAGFAESVYLELDECRQAVQTLHAAGRLLFDWRARVVYRTNSVTEDPPVTPNATIAAARQFAELSDGLIKDTIRREMEAALGRQAVKLDKKTGKPKTERLLKVWNDELSEAASGSSSGEAVEASADNASGDVSEGPSRARAHVPIPLSDPDPDPAAAYQRAWARLPMPPFAAAAARDFEEAVHRWAPEPFKQLVEQLACSKWVTNRLDIPPTLRRLLKPDDYAERILFGEFAAFEPAAWHCDQCGQQHRMFADCPPAAAPCEGCGSIHPADVYCHRLHALQVQRRHAAREPVAAGVSH